MKERKLSSSYEIRNIYICNHQFSNNLQGCKDLCGLQVCKIEGSERDHNRCTRKASQGNWVIKLGELPSPSVLKTRGQWQKHDSTWHMVEHVPHVSPTCITIWEKKLLTCAPASILSIFLSKRPESWPGTFQPTIKPHLPRFLASKCLSLMTKCWTLGSKQDCLQEVLIRGGHIPVCLFLFPIVQDIHVIPKAHAAKVQYMV